MNVRAIEKVKRFEYSVNLENQNIRSNKIVKRLKPKPRKQNSSPSSPSLLSSFYSVFLFLCPKFFIVHSFSKLQAKKPDFIAFFPFSSLFISRFLSFLFPVFFVVYSFLKPKSKKLDFILSCFYFSLYSLFSSPFPSPFTALLNNVSLRSRGETPIYKPAHPRLEGHNYSNKQKPRVSNNLQSLRNIPPLSSLKHLDFKSFSQHSPNHTNQRFLTTPNKRTKNNYRPNHHGQISRRRRGISRNPRRSIRMDQAQRPSIRTR